MLTCIRGFADPVHEFQVLSSAVVDEILCGIFLIPLARANLRAPFRASLSISDASERGGAAAEVESFVPSLSRVFGERVSSEMSALNEQRVRVWDAPVSICLRHLPGNMSGPSKMRARVRRAFLFLAVLWGASFSSLSPFVVCPAFGGCGNGG